MSKSPEAKYSIGVDYGTNSVRALIVNVSDGSEVASAAFDYPSGEHGILLDRRDPHVARQNPADYIAGFVSTVSSAIATASKQKGFRAENVIGIGIDTTASTPIPVDEEGVPLAFQRRFKKNLAAQAWLWKDHTSVAEAAEITDKAAKSNDAYLSKCGGVYSSEWYWAKILHCKQESPDVFDAAYAWVELSDFVPGYITGNTKPETMPRGIGAAGHKAMFHDDWGGLPRKTFLRRLHPELAKVAEHFTTSASTGEQSVGGLTAEIAAQVGLPEGTPVATGAIDAHMGAVGAGVKPGTLVKIIGTSTCDITVWPLDQPIQDVPGICGIVPGSVLPSMYGLEAGQAAVGDIFNWFVRQLVPAKYGHAGEAHATLTAEAETIAPGESGLLALDWNNGNRTVLVDPLLTGLVVGQTLHTTAAEIYRALIEATAFGSLTIINRFEQCGVQIKDVINCGGIAERNPMVMQIYADVCNRPMKISRSAETCALGAAIFGSVVGGAYRTVPAAQRKMTGTPSIVYKPRKSAASTYAELYPLYQQLHDAFGVPDHAASLGNVMKDLITIRSRVMKGK